MKRAMKFKPILIFCILLTGYVGLAQDVSMTIEQPKGTLGTQTRGFGDNQIVFIRQTKEGSKSQLVKITTYNDQLKETGTTSLEISNKYRINSIVHGNTLVLKCAYATQVGVVRIFANVVSINLETLKYFQVEYEIKGSFSQMRDLIYGPIDEIHYAVSTDKLHVLKNVGRSYAISSFGPTGKLIKTTSLSLAGKEKVFTMGVLSNDEVYIGRTILKSNSPGFVIIDSETFSKTALSLNERKPNYKFGSMTVKYHKSNYYFIGITKYGENKISGWKVTKWDKKTFREQQFYFSNDNLEVTETDDEVYFETYFNGITNIQTSFSADGNMVNFIQFVGQQQAPSTSTSTVYAPSPIIQHINGYVLDNDLKLTGQSANATNISMRAINVTDPYLILGSNSSKYIYADFNSLHTIKLPYNGGQSELTTKAVGYMVNHFKLENDKLCIYSSCSPKVKNPRKVKSWCVKIVSP